MLAVILNRRDKAKPSPLSARTTLCGVLLGVVMFAAAGLQQVGIVSTTASRSAFLTGLYVLIVPAIGVLFRQKITAGHIAGGVLAVIGLTMLGVGGSDSTGDKRRDQQPPCGLHPRRLARPRLRRPLGTPCRPHRALSRPANPFALAWAQFVTVAVLSVGVAIATEPTTVEGLRAGWLPLLYSGVFVIAIAFTLQIIAQKDAPPTHAAVLMSLEAVFGALFGMLLLHESLSAWELAGCVVMFAGMLVSQLHRGERTTLERIEQQEPV